MHARAVLTALGYSCALAVATNSDAQTISRGPYLQIKTEDAVTVRWRTSSASTSRVRYGLAPDQLNQVVQNTASVVEHQLALPGLQADTTYYYAVGTIAQDLAGGPDYRFRTAPEPGARVPLRVWVIGDSGTADSNAAAVRDAYLAFAGGVETDVWLMLGDNAYTTGTDSEYQAAVFDMYPTVLRRTAVWPTMGNHDQADSSNQTGPYYSIFTLPGQGQAGGQTSGTESYYSFDHANVHFICLNSEDGDRTPPSSMLSWLETDLADTVQDWIVAYWHHPPYSKGHHDSDSSSDSSGRLVQMRENALPILEDAGVDLVLTGHSHSYERSLLIDGHYDTSDTFDSSMLVDGGDGRLDGDGAYQKETQGPEPHAGTGYVVAGSSGQTDSGPLDHPVMFSSLEVLGSVVLDFEGDRLELTFLDSVGQVRDYYTLVKNTATAPAADFVATPAVGPAPLDVTFEDLSTTNAASWAWDLDGNGTIDSTAREPTMTYAVAGPRDVSLTVGNAGGVHTIVKERAVCVQGPSPPAVLGVVVGKGGVLSWPPGAPTFDVVRGDVALLLATAGAFFSTADRCWVVSTPTFTDPEPPPLGSGFYYLVRAVGPCGETGTFDSGSPAQRRPRDDQIAVSGVVCVP